MDSLTYSTLVDVRAYCEDLCALPSDDAELTRLVLRSERDVDLALQALTRTANGLRVTPSADLQPWQQALLSRAVGAQAAYRVEMGPEFFIKDQYEYETGPDGFAQRGRLARLAPAARGELENAGLVAEAFMPPSVLMKTALTADDQ